MITIMQDSITELYRIFDIINEEKYEGRLPQPIITIQKTPKALGHCTTHKYWANCETEDPQEDNDYYEINIASNYLNRGAHEIVHTLMHESVHLFDSAVLGKKDCNGKKHNKRFFKTATEIAGLKIDDNDSRVGYGFTELTPELEKWIDEVVKPDSEKFAYFYYIPPKQTEEKEPPKKFPLTLWCPDCQLEVKVEEGLMDYNIPIVCPVCNNDFEVKPKGKRGRKAKED